MEDNPVVSAPAESPKAGAVEALFAEKKAAKPAEVSIPEKQEPVVEKESAKSDSIAKQLALIARESKKLAEEKKSFLSEREKQKAAIDRAKALDELEGLLKTNPLAALKKHGLDYEELIKIELQRQAEEADPTLRKVRELEHKLSEKERIEAENQVKYAAAQQQRYIDQHVSDIRTHIAANADKYEFLNTYRAEKDVFAKIKEVFDKSVKKDAEGRIKEFKELTIEEACDLVEGEFEESAANLLKLKKIQNKFSKQKEDAQPSKQETKEKPKSVSLNNSLSGSSEKPRPLTKAERAERAFAALHGSH